MPRENPLPLQNSRFRVEIDGIVQANFQEVIMPEARIDVIEYREGADPNHAVKKLSGMTRYTNLILKSGVSGNNELYQWIKAVMEQGAFVHRKNIAVIVMSQTGDDVARWTFEKAWPVAYRVSNLNAQSGEVVFEALEITFEGFTKEI